MGKAKRRKLTDPNYGKNSGSKWKKSSKRKLFSLATKDDISDIIFVSILVRIDHIGLDQFFEVDIPFLNAFLDTFSGTASKGKKMGSEMFPNKEYVRAMIEQLGDTFDELRQVFDMPKNVVSLPPDKFYPDLFYSVCKNAPKLNN